MRVFPNFRFTFGDFDVRIWRVLVWCRLILPVPVLLKRFFAPVCVFNLGIVFSLWTGLSGLAAEPVRQGLPCPLEASISITHGSHPAKPCGFLLPHLLDRKST